MNTNPIIKNLPNQLTVSRILLIFIFVALANIDANKINFVEIPKHVSDTCHLIAYLVAILAGITDFLDGKIARKYKCESDFGRLMDPLADKIFIVATYVMMADYRIIPAWIVVVVLSREFLVTGLRLLAASDGVVLSADKSGKFKGNNQKVDFDRHWRKNEKTAESCSVRSRNVRSRIYDGG